MDETRVWPEVEQWLKDNKVLFTMAGSTCLIFDQPPHLDEARGAAITSALAHGKRAAMLLRARGWAVHAAKDEASALRWLVSLGYGHVKDISNRPTVRIPPGGAIYGKSKIDLTVVVGFVVSNPGITSRVLARELTAARGRRVERKAANRALDAIGWGDEERELFRDGMIEAPVLVTG